MLSEAGVAAAERAAGGDAVASAIAPADAGGAASFEPVDTTTHDRILILDFGSQVTQLIARRLRETHVYCEIHPYDVDDAFVRGFGPKGIILSGSHASVMEDEAARAPQAVFELGVPVLGICYGMQTMAAQLGGSVETGKVREFGYAEVRARGHTSLFRDIQDFATPEGHGMLKVWMSHGDKVTAMPHGFKLMASTESCPIAAMADEDRRFYAVQFHPEVTHTLQGKRILARFAHDICRCGEDWNMPDYADEAVAKIREQVGADEVILGLSGGVDSSVAAALIHRAIGEQLTCVFVDHGLLRLDEAKQVMRTFADNLGVRVIHIAAEERFMTALAGVADPEQKRKIIGREFVHVFQEEAAKIANAKWLAQGTIYPDVIESAGAKTKKAHTIKSHHNVGGLPETLHLRLLEPLRDLFKDEVRELGLALGLPREMVFRHPFPGPGLGVRILGEVKHEYAELLRRADAIFIDELRKTPLDGRATDAPAAVEGTVGTAEGEARPANWYEATAQAFAVFLPVKSVGVMGDGRTYDYVVALRAVQTTDFMTAHWAPLPHALLAKVSNRIINEVRGINRVVYDISSKPPATIEWE
jgi:GMP synthase (glutamine-hydrolysing)